MSYIDNTVNNTLLITIMQTISSLKAPL